MPPALLDTLGVLGVFPAEEEEPFPPTRRLNRPPSFLEKEEADATEPARLEAWLCPEAEDNLRESGTCGLGPREGDSLLLLALERSLP